MQSVLNRTSLTWAGIAGLALILAGCATVAPATETGTETGTEAVAEAATEAAAVTNSGEALVVYSGRSESLVGPLLEKFEAESGIAVEVRYGDTAELAATILEEGDNSPADVFFGQDAGALGALSQTGRLSVLPDETLNRVAPQFRSPSGEWVGASGRARVLVYNTDQLTTAELPQNVFELTDPKWQGKVGWVPGNASFQAFVTAMRKVHGEDVTAQWLTDMLANDVQTYDSNPAIVEAVANGEILAGLCNHYYLFRFLAEQGESYPARNHHFPDGGADALVNVAGAGILKTARNPEAALVFVNYLLSEEAQGYFASETNEYPLTNADLVLNPLLVPLADLNTPALDLSDLSDLQGTLTLLQETGVLQ